MKTVEEFIQHLENDPEFESQAQAYENSDEFMEFVKREGYDFTLDQLLDKFKHREEGRNQPAEPPPPAARSAEEFIQRLQDDPEFERKAQAFENNDDFMEFVKREGYDFTLDQLTDGFKQGDEVLELQEASPLPEPLESAEIPISQPPNGSEFLQQTDPSSHSAETQKRQQTLSPKFEGFVGGRRRGMKWQGGNSDRT